MSESMENGGENGGNPLHSGMALRIWEEATIAMLGKEEAAALAPQEKEFLHECLRVKREREGLPTPPRSPATWNMPTPPRPPACERGLGRWWLGGPIMRLHHVSASSPSLATFPSRPRRKKETEEGLRFAFHELLAATAALQSREKETERRVSKLEQKALSNAKVASEFQRVWTGMTTMAEKINAELKKLQARTEERESGGSACEESSLNCAELSPFSVKSTASELRGGRLSFSPKNSDNVAEDVRQREGLGNKRCEKRDSAVNTSVEHANGSVDTASICSKMMENRLKEEGRRLERVECEVHQQLLETRNCIERLDSEVDSLLIFKQHLSPNIRTKTQELQEEMDRTAEQFHSITKDLEKDLRTNIRELDLKIERLTVMFGTAAFFQRTPHPVQGMGSLNMSAVESFSHINSTVELTGMHGLSLESPQRERGRDEAQTSAKGEDQKMCSADLHDVHEMLKTLGTAVKALQKHVSTGNKDIERVRVSCATDCQGLRIEMRRQEKVVNGYMESWSVESAGMTEQVLQLWKFVRTSSSSAERGKKEAYHTARVNKDYGKIAAAQEYAIEEKAEGGGGAGNGELGALGDSVEGDGSARSSASSGLGIEM